LLTTKKERRKLLRVKHCMNHPMGIKGEKRVIGRGGDSVRGGGGPSFSQVADGGLKGEERDGAPGSKRAQFRRQKKRSPAGSSRERGEQEKRQNRVKWLGTLEVCRAETQKKKGPPKSDHPKGDKPSERRLVERVLKRKSQGESEGS